MTGFRGSVRSWMVFRDIKYLHNYRVYPIYVGEDPEVVASSMSVELIPGECLTCTEAYTHARNILLAEEVMKL